MMLSIELLRFDEEKVARDAAQFIHDQVEESGLKGAVVAVSGGIDSAVTLALTVRGLGKERVKAITMPEHDVTPDEDVIDVMHLSRMLDVTCNRIDITPIMNLLYKKLPLYDSKDLITSGNLKPRIRMTIAYHYANALKSLVVGSSNKTEWLLGYFTKYGDGASDIMPLADLYKTQVRQLAQKLEISKKIIHKIPSAHLWPGQTSEGELEIKFEELDLILYGIEHGLGIKEIAEELKLEPSLVRRIMDRVKRTEHKRRLPLILRVNPKVFDTISRW